MGGTSTGAWGRRDLTLIGLLVGLALVRNLLFATIQWPWYSPDEPDHTELALLTALHGPGVQPDQRVRALRLTIGQSLYEWRAAPRPPQPDAPLPGTWAGEVGRQPPLYYLLAGWAARLAPADNIVAQLYAMRVVSAILGASVVAGCYLAGRLLSPTTRVLALALGVMTLFQTQLGALSSVVNNDILAIAATTWALVACIAFAQSSGAGRRHWAILVGVLVALAVAGLAKRTALVIVPSVLLSLLIAGLRALWPMLQRRLVRPALVLAMSTLALGLSLLTVSLTLTDGRLVARPWLQQVIVRLTNRPYEMAIGAFERLWEERPAEEWQRRIIEPFAESLWGRLGRIVELNLPGWWYTSHTILLTAAAVGLLVVVVRAAVTRSITARQVLLTTLIGLPLLGSGIVALGPYLLELYSGPPFGRYFLPSILPWTLISALGLLWPWPQAWRGPLLLLLVLVLAGLDAYALFGLLISHFSIRLPAAL